MVKKKFETNSEFITDLIKNSQYGDLVPVFILVALYNYCYHVEVGIASSPYKVFSDDVWVSCAKDILKQLDFQYAPEEAKEDGTHDGKRDDNQNTNN